MSLDRIEPPPWIKRFPGRPDTATLVFPHAGGAAAAYRGFGMALAARGVETYLVQYPQRGERLAHPAASTVDELASDVLDAADWAALGPLRLFGHCLGALVGFEVARQAARRGVTVRELWVSAGQAPSTVADSRPVPTTDDALLADIIDLGGTDAALLDDDDFLALLLPAVRADYRAFNAYTCGRDVRIAGDVHALGGREDRRVDQELLRQWSIHTDGAFTVTEFDGGHFYLDDHLHTVAELVSST